MSQRDEPRRRTPVIKPEPPDTDKRPQEAIPHTAHAFTRRQLMGEELMPTLTADFPRVLLSGLKDCKNPACNRLTSSRAAYCCFGCSQADGKYDPEGYHSPDCDQRAIERGILPLGTPPRLPEPETDGTIIGFQRQFHDDEPVYSYAAIKTSRGWYHTGGIDSEPLSWRQLLGWMDSGQKTLPVIWAATDFTEVVQTGEPDD